MMTGALHPYPAKQKTRHTDPTFCRARVRAVCQRKRASGANLGALSPTVQRSGGTCPISDSCISTLLLRLIDRKSTPWKIAIGNPFNAHWKLAICFHEFFDRVPGGPMGDEQFNRQQCALLAAAHQISSGCTWATVI